MTAVELVQRGNAEQDPDYQKLAAYFFDEQAPFHLASLTSLGQTLGVSRHDLQSKLIRLVAAQLALARVDRQRLEQWITSRLTQDRLLCYVDFATFDETPMKASQRGGVTGTTTSTASSSHSEPAPPPTLPLPGLPSGVAALEKSLRQEGVVLKFLQTRQRYGMLIRTDLGLVKIFGTFHVPLQILERATAAVLKHALVENGTVSAWANSFQLQVRSSCTDRAPENHLAEQAIAQERQGAWLYLHTDSVSRRHSRPWSQGRYLVCYTQPSACKKALPFSSSGRLCVR